MAKGFSSDDKTKKKDVSQKIPRKDIESLINQGRYDEALQVLDKANRTTDSQIEKEFIHKTKGDLYVMRHQWDSAMKEYKRYFSYQPESITLSFRKKLFHEAASLGANFRTSESLKLHCCFLSIEPNHGDAIRNFALVLRRAGALMDAEKYARRYIDIKPDASEGYVTLATVLSDQGKWDETIKCLKKAIKINPDNTNAMINLASLFHIFRDLDNAYIWSSRACEKDQTNRFVWLDALTALRRVCSFERLERIDWWKLLENSPAENISTCMLQYLTMTTTTEDIYRFKNATRAWGITQSNMYKVKGDFSGRNYLARTDQSHIIKIGIISADFKDHSVARFILPLFKHSKEANLEIYAYSTQNVDDAYTKRFRTYAKEFKSIEKSNAANLAEIVRADNIDALFDITGFTSGARMAMLAQRLAPVQISWLGFPGSIGLPELDYLLLDKYLAPKSDEYINEQKMCMEGSSICFSDMKDIAITRKLPEEVRGEITFGSLNNPYKFTRANIERWSKIMQEIPNSKLFLVRCEYQSYYLRKNLREEFQRNNINPERIVFFNNQKENRNYLDCYNEIDISLDTFPLTGGTTTIDALWMGVPVVTIEGEAIHQRISSSIIRQIGQSDLIAKSESEFIQKSISLARNRGRREELRKTLRDQILKSSLCDGDAFVANFRKAIVSALAQAK